jgi:predicted permease
MTFTAALRSLAARLFSTSGKENDIDEELRSHIQHRADDLAQSGLPRAEAERRARIEFGGYEKFREESHEAMGGVFFQTLVQDVRFAVRVLRKSPGFSVAAVLTLALAIGANAVVFSVMNALILRPLDVPHAQSLYATFHSGSAIESYPDYVDMRDRNRSFEALAAFNVAVAGLDTGKNPASAWVYETSGNYFDVLGQKPYLGHFFHAADEHGPNSAPYVVLTYAYWQNRFQSDPGVVGRVVLVNKHPYTILGVASPEFHGTLLFFNPNFFIPIVNEEEIGPDDLNDRKNSWIFMTLGHLKPGVTLSQAASDLNSIAAYLEKTYPKEDTKRTFALGRPNLYGDYLGRPVTIFMTGLMLVSGLILLAACANLGSLFAARAADRSREVALRLALGSSRRRILRGLFTEAVLISLAGGAVGLLGSVVLLRGLSQWQPFPLWPIHLAVNPDGTVYTVALLITIASGLLFGAVPVRQVLRTNPYEVVKSGSTGRVGRSVTLRDILLIVQISICAVLITTSTIAVRGLVRSMNDSYGFERKDRILVTTDLGMAGYHGDQVAPMQKRMNDAIAAIPGVQSVGFANILPLGASSDQEKIFKDTASDLRPSNALAESYLFKVSPEYFKAAGTVLLAGRPFSWHDDSNAPRVAVVNGELARMLFGSPDKALGAYFKAEDGARLQVVGIAEVGKYASLNEDPMPALFLPILQSPSTSIALVVRSGRDPLQLSAAIRSTLQNVDPGLPFDTQTQDDGLQALMFGPRMATLSLGVLGIMGAVLSITGIFGMAAFSVSRRLRELGIRIALGAQRTEVLRAALQRPVKLLAFGSLAGLVLGLLATKGLAFIIYRASARDPLVLAVVVLAMALLGLVATWIPAQRALASDPLMLLRDE